MKTVNFKVVNKSTITEIPGSWTTKDYTQILETLDIKVSQDSPENELKELCHIALSELSPEEAAKIVLNYLVDIELNEGQIDQISHEMVEDKMWEEYPDMNLHATIYNSNFLLYEAFNGKFPKPDALKIQILLTEISPFIQQELLEGNNNLYLQILSSGMNEHGLINRLFGKEIEEGKLEKVSGIVWKSSCQKVNQGLLLEIISSTYWLEDFEEDEGFFTPNLKSDSVE